MVSRETGSKQVSDIQAVIASLDHKGNFVVLTAGFLSSFSLKSNGLTTNIFLVLIVLSLLSAITTIWPRSGVQKGELSWPAIARMDDEAIVAALIKSESSPRDMEILRLVSLAKLVRTKTIAVRLSLVFLASALLVFAFGFIMGYNIS
jgi:Family of unknown function (DUF5706)